MDDSLRNKVIELCGELTDRGVLNVVGLKMGPECSWTSFLVIGTVTSRVHMNGSAKTTEDLLKKMGLESGGKKKNEAISWQIIDGGEVVVSLMDADARKFYALEERWYESEMIYEGGDLRKQND